MRKWKRSWVKIRSELHKKKTPKKETNKDKQSETNKKLSIVEKISKKQLSEKDLEPILWELEIALLENDVAKEVAEQITSDIKSDLEGENVSRRNVSNKIKDSLKDSIENILTKEKPDIFKLIDEKEGPYLMIFFGFNGTGKTMTIGKFAKLLKDKGYSVVLAAGDTFRAAAIEQLEEHAEKVEVPIIKQHRGADSAAVIYDAVEHAKSKGIDVVLADTAGRASTNTNLMDELKKVVRVNSPNLKIFIGDALTGNDAAEQARSFDEAVGIDSSVLTKIDTDAKGGACLSVAHVTDGPILYLGTGQGYDDMIEFTADWFISKVFTNSQSI
ncbi:MAG: signal recognition particle-docking protein FtsY [Candidatus Undinarchaeales archaeon]